MAGELDVEAMLLRLTAKQFRNWEIYYDLEPFGEMRADYRAASITQMLYNVNRGSKQKALPITEFLLKYDADPPPKQDQLALMRVLAAAHAEPIVDAHTDADVTADMKDQVTRARAAMKGAK